VNVFRALLCASLVALGACREQGATGQSTPESQRQPAKALRPIIEQSPPPPSDKPVFIAPESTLREEVGETKAAIRILALAKTLRDSVVETAYQGRTVVKPSRGYYAWDCSGMSSWILKRSAPTALRALEKSRPVARDYFKMIERAPAKRDRRGWRKLAHVSDARPGDLFAWLRSPISKSRVSGHVGFFVTAPTPHPDAPNVYTARIMDATSLPHGNDTRAQEGEGGFGFGTMLFATDASGKTIGYGWHGERSLLWGFMPAEVIYGRVTR
tara:strand:- start:31164 stop:31973 length:810 start_codon:yes stop_codon:yes gene_type:complete